MVATSKDGVSALSLQRTLEIGSYPTAWAMLHRLRSVMVNPDRTQLSGTVEVDEIRLGGGLEAARGAARSWSWPPRRQARSTRSPVGVA